MEWWQGAMVSATRWLQLLLVGAFEDLLQHQGDEHALRPKTKLLLKFCQSLVDAERERDLQGDVRLFHGSWDGFAMMPGATCSPQDQLK